MEIIKQISNLLDSGKLSFGSKDTEKALLFGDAKAVILANNIKRQISERLKYLADLENIPCVELPLNSKEMGERFGKAYALSAVAVIEEGNSKILEVIKK